LITTPPFFLVAQDAALFPFAFAAIQAMMLVLVGVYF